VPHAVGHPRKKPPGGLKARPLHCGSAGYVVFRFLRLTPTLPHSEKPRIRTHGAQIMRWPEPDEQMAEVH
jgi:hypothetical protein